MDSHYLCLGIFEGQRDYEHVQILINKNFHDIQGMKYFPNMKSCHINYF